MSEKLNEESEYDSRVSQFIVPPHSTYIVCGELVENKTDQPMAVPISQEFLRVVSERQ